MWWLHFLLQTGFLCMAKNMAPVLLSPQWKVCLLSAALEEGLWLACFGLPASLDQLRDMVPWLGPLVLLAQLCGQEGRVEEGSGGACWAHTAMAAISTPRTSHSMCSIRLRLTAYQCSVLGSQPLLYLSPQTGGGNKYPADHYNAGCRVWQ